MADKAKKPKGWRAFDSLTKKLIAVPKSEVEEQEKKRSKVTRKK